MHDAGLPSSKWRLQRHPGNCPGGCNQPGWPLIFLDCSQWPFTAAGNAMFPSAMLSKMNSQSVAVSQARAMLGVYLRLFARMDALLHE